MMAVLENIHDAVVITDLDFRVKFWNHAAEKVYGWTSAEAVSRIFSDLVTTEYSEEIREKYKQSLMNEGHWTGEVVQFSRSGRRLQIISSVTILRDSSGNVSDVVAINGDVTDAREREAAFEKGRNHLQTIISSLEDIVFEVDNDCVFLNVWTGRPEKLFYPSETFLGKKFHEIFPPDYADQFSALVRQVVESRKQSDIEYPDLQNKNHWYSASASYLPRTSDGLPGVTLVIKDISSKKHFEQDLERARELAESASIAKSNFLANMSHEIRTPLNVITGFAQVMAAEASESGLPSKFSDHLKGILTASDHLNRIITDILDFSRIEAGKMDMFEEEFSIHELLRNLGRSFESQVREKKLRFTVEIGELVPEFIIADPGKINQILLNLIGNAVKFTSEGRGVILKAECPEGGECLLFQVMDQGIGIPENKLDRIFDVFEQGDSSITRSFGGSGLGLSIVRKLVDLLGGSIQVESTRDEGSIFSVVIPFRPSRKRIRLPVNFTEKATYPGKRLLVVEDNPLNREMMKALLEQMEIVVSFASNGEEGVEQALSYRPDLIFMDVHMPVMDGIEAASRIRNMPECRSTPIVFLSADARTTQTEVTSNLGFTDYITKPVNLLSIRKVMEKFFKKSVFSLERGQRPIDDLDRETRKLMISKFLSGTQQSIDKMRESLNQASPEALRSEAHSLRGGCSILGGRVMAEICRELEYGEGELAAPGSILSSLQAVWDAWKIELERELNEYRD